MNEIPNMKQEDVVTATNVESDPRSAALAEAIQTTAELVVESVAMPTIIIPEANANTPINTGGNGNNIDSSVAPPQSGTGRVVLTTPAEFQDDVMNRLGRANGNVFWRKPGVEGVHDGQIMVRLKKKRFIVIDYGIDPDKVNVSLSSITSSRHVMIPPGAGREKCGSSDCTKVGIPVLLYDSHPEEPLSLYLRSGLCFTCQRQLNEKRRTQRKRKSDDHPSATAAGALLASTTSGNMRKEISAGGGIIMPNMMPGYKKYRTANEPNNILTLSPNAIVIEPSLLGHDVEKLLKQGPAKYGVREIISDVQTELKSGLINHVDHLLHSLTDATVPPSSATQNHTTNNATSTTANDEALAAAAAAAIAATSNNEATSADATAAAIAAASVSSTMEEASAAAAAIAANTTIDMDQLTSTTNDQPRPSVNAQETSYEISLHYENAMSSIKKCIYLLTQFNASFVGTATTTSDISNNSVINQAANAAVAAATTSNNMNVLLHAATDVKDTSNNIAASTIPVAVPIASNIAGADINGMNVEHV